jgi:hypothetical protein
MMEAARTSETLVNFYQTTQRYNPEDSHLWVELCLQQSGGHFQNAELKLDISKNHHDVVLKTQI